MSESDPPKRVVLILGMHRSGTSLLTGLIANAGVSIGNSVMPSREDNPKGFFENQRIVDFNERLLNEIGLSWSSWRSLPKNWVRELDSSFMAEATQLLVDEFGEADLICIKDPRISRLLPFWRDILSDAGFETHAVLTTRDLTEVAASLQKRDGMGMAQANALWLRYNLDAMEASAGLPGLHVSYETVLSDPASALASVSQLLGVSLDLVDESFADRALKHHQTSEGVVWAEVLRQNCERFPEAPDPNLESIVYSLVAELAEQERVHAKKLLGELADPDDLSAREAGLFQQAEEAKQHAISLARELETGRQYIADMERVLEEKETSLQQANRRLEDNVTDSQVYVESLKRAIEEAKTYNDSLAATLEHKEAEILSQVNTRETLESELQTRDEYAKSLVLELASKEAELATAHAELQKLHDELAATHRQLIEKTNDLDAELQKFQLQRRMIKMFKRDSDG